MEFLSRNTSQIDSVQLEIIQKSKDLQIDPQGREQGSSSGERVMLKRVDPPKFTGDILEFPDFQRRWKATVGKAKFGQEAELDHLRDNVPSEASKMIVGETTMV